ncbi:unnamed protein product [Penicillium manginii]
MMWFSKFSFSFPILLLLVGDVVAAASAPRLHKQQACEHNGTVARKEWGEMAVAERINYTDAVKCLTRKPPRLPTKDYPGVRSRFDDFVA